VARRVLVLVEVGGEVLRDVPVEQEPQHVLLEVPAVHRAAQVVRDPPDGLVQLGPLGLTIHAWYLLNAVIGEIAPWRPNICPGQAASCGDSTQALRQPRTSGVSSVCPVRRPV